MAYVHYMFYLGRREGCVLVSGFAANGGGWVALRMRVDCIEGVYFCFGNFKR